MNFSIYFRLTAFPAGSGIINTFLKLSPQNNLKPVVRTFVNKSETTLNNVCRYRSGIFDKRFSSNIPCFARNFASEVTQPPKKRLHKKRYVSDVDPQHFEEGRYPVVAFATAQEYNLENLKIGLMQQKLYRPQPMGEQEAPDVLLTVANYRVGSEPRHMFFFREGSVVLWNCTDLEISNVLAFLKPYEEQPYEEFSVIREKELMSYKYQPESNKKCSLQGSMFILNPEPENILEKYTFSNAMAQSVKLGIWEATLDQYADSISNITRDLQIGNPIRMSREEVLRKTGALYALRHHINLESDLLDTPDFYWEQAELEKLYLATVAYFSITRRTKILNEKLSHCAELVELVAAQLSDNHHVRLEWMIIILIMVEVGFEVLHFTDKFYNFMG